MLSADYILSFVTEEEVFRHFCSEAKIGKVIRSPLRDDKNPSFSVYRKNGKVMYYDHSTGDGGNCFEFVKKMYNVDYHECLKIIASEMNIMVNNHGYTRQPLKESERNKKYVSNSKRSDIRIKKEDWNDAALSYWLDYGINLEILNKYNIINCAMVFLNGEHIISSTRKVPCYAYLFYKDNQYSFKIYRPKAKTFRWMSNTNRTVLQGWDQLPDNGDILIITKSLKDVMVLRSLGYYSISMQNEVSSIKDTVVQELYDRFNSIYILQDFDYAGVSGVNKLRKAYGFKYFFIQSFSNRSNGLKDISDYRKAMGEQKTKELLKNFINEDKEFR
jgi:hypothetical protein